MKFAVFNEPADQDIYDMTVLTEVEVVEAEDEDDAIMVSEAGELMGLRVWVVKLKDEALLGYHDSIPEEWVEP